MGADAEAGAGERIWPTLQSSQDYEREHGRPIAAPQPRRFFSFGSAWERHDDPEVDR
ncbi:MAG: hypothetical protein QOH84_5935 [Kribbellaceae bacterium]|jgi:hypothetical protein|nr:hypothetical protein [Kribbellaceae bacterium]